MDFLIVGLGNPGAEYKNTRHNIGFLSTDFIADKNPINSSFETKFKSLFTTVNIAGTKIGILKPQTFMNLSGQAVILAKNFYKIPIENIIVIHDDIDIAFAKIKTKTGGSAGGHNGLKSIDSNIGKDYFRIRIGVDRPEDSRFEISDYVLSNFSKTEVAELGLIFNDVYDIILEYINDTKQ